MDEPQTISSGEGILKDSYIQDTALSDALKRKRKKLSETILGDTGGTNNASDS
jgi:hypothetical protein